MAGLISYGAYVPHYRLQRSAIRAALGEGGGRGTRAVASFDEDTTSMGVEAARIALRSAATAPERVLFSTARAAYEDKTNANVLHAALRLDPSVLTVDLNGSVRSGAGAMAMAAESMVPTLVVTSDRRTGAPGGADESRGGDAAAAFLFGDDDPVADVLACATATAEFLDRWRVPGASASRVWEERFGEHAYQPLADAAFADALKRAQVVPEEVDVLVVAGLHARANAAFAKCAGVARVADALADTVGNSGVAHPGLVLASMLDEAEPGQVIVVVTVADGATALVLRTTDRIVERRSARPVREQVGRGDDSLRYADFLAWNGDLTKELPRRPDPVGPAGPPSLRSAGYKFALVASQCEECSTIHLPAGRVCVRCGAVDHMTDVPMADRRGVVVTYTVDRLAYSPGPPPVVAIVDFEGGGRLNCEMTDVDPDSVRVGDAVEMTFRRFITASGIHNYFWKARPATPDLEGHR
jgi:hydroxymethylglutaryl-CoA synthase